MTAKSECGSRTTSHLIPELESLLLLAFDLVSNEWPETQSLTCLNYLTTKCATSTQRKVPKPVSKAWRFPRVGRRTRRSADNSRLSPRKTIFVVTTRCATNPKGKRRLAGE